MKVRDKREKREQKIENYIDRIHFWKPYFDKGMTFKKLNENNVRIQRAIDDVMFDLTGKGFEVNVMRKIENKVSSDIVLKREVKESSKFYFCRFYFMNVNFNLYWKIS